MTQFRNQDLSIAYWLSTHRQNVKQVGKYLGIGVCSLIWLNAIWQTINVIRLWPATQRSYDTIDQVTINTAILGQAQSLQSTKPVAIAVTSDTSDFYVLVTNPNTRYAATFDYTFTWEGEAFNFTNEAIMPNTSRYLVFSDQLNDTTTTANVGFTLNNIKWQRLPASQATYSFTVKAGALKAVTSSNTTALAGTEYQATVLNNNALGFRTAIATVIVRSEIDQSIQGIRTYRLTNLESFSEQNVTVFWPRRFAFNSPVSVDVFVQYLAPDNLILPGDTL